jgi:serine/threonine protein kinase
MSGLSDAAVTRLRAAAAAAEPTTVSAFELVAGVDRAAMSPESAVSSAARYELLEEIGRGGMGVVHRALDRELGREVAIKIPHEARSLALERRLRTEARVLARLEHPGIVPIHDVGRLADGRLFYVMKRVRGRTLREHLPDVPGIAERLRLFGRICEPVAFAHAHGCIHRDLKPENVMVGPFGEVMVMDWGVARIAEAPDDPAGIAESATAGGTQPGTIVGTVGFMPPEQARGASSTIDERADVYGLGALLHLLLTDEAPAGADPAAEIRGRGDVPRPLRSICARALEADPAARYRAVTALARDVARFEAGQAVEAHEETLMDRAVRFGRTYRTAILLVLAYIIMRTLVAWLGS